MGWDSPSPANSPPRSIQPIEEPQAVPLHPEISERELAQLLNWTPETGIGLAYNADSIEFEELGSDDADIEELLEGIPRLRIYEERTEVMVKDAGTQTKESEEAIASKKLLDELDQFVSEALARKDPI